jgi:carboxyl-terminal processing protease
MRVTKVAITLAAGLAAVAVVGPLGLWRGHDRAAIAAESKGAKFSDDTYKYLELFGDVFERVRKDYVEEVSDQELLENAINGMLTSLDPHSGYLPAKGFQEMQEQTKGEFGGLGIEVTMEGGFVKVVSPIDDTPAARAGVQPGDFIVAIDGKPVLGLTLNEAVDKMRGPVDTAITITVRRQGVDPFDLKMNRAVVKIQSVRHRVEGDIGYIRITSFNEQTQAGLEAAIKDLKAKVGPKLKGYVLDLRNNPGGLLDQAVSVSDTFLDHGEIVSTRTRRAEETQRFNAKPGDLADGKPLVVLINDGSASASEIVAGALQDHGRAILLGTKSFGKGSVQTIIPLGRGESAMRLTTARYYTPSGRSIQALGITPDIEVAQAQVTRTAQGFRRAEADLRGALRNDTLDADGRPKQPGVPAGAPPGALPAGSAVPKDEAPAKPGAKPEAKPEAKADGKDAKDGAKKDTDADDYQLARALDLLQGIALYQKASAASAR